MSGNEVDNVFISNVLFDGQHNFPPYVFGDSKINGDNVSINLNGEENIKKIIEFYIRKELKGSKIKISCSDRIKINCLVGNNGSGKSRALEYINSIYTKQGSKYQVIFDDLSVLNLNKYSIYKDIILDIARKYNFSYDTFIYSLYQNEHKNKLLYSWLGKGKLNVDFFKQGNVSDASRFFMNKVLNFDVDDKHTFTKMNIGSYDDNLEVLELINTKVLNTKNFSPRGEVYTSVLEYFVLYIFSSSHYSTKIWDKLGFNGDESKFSEESIKYKKNIMLRELNTIFCKDFEGSYFKRIYCGLKKVLQTILDNDKEVQRILDFFVNNLFYRLDFTYTLDDGKERIFSDFSSGEKSAMLRLGKVHEEILNSEKDRIIVLIDEPDLHLHLDWQRLYIEKLVNVFLPLLNDNKTKSIHFILATHSPFILSDLPGECIVKLEKKGEGTTDISYMDKEKTFGANYIDLIQDGFFFKDENLMGSFAENIIGDVAQLRREEITNNEYVEDLELLTEIENEIGDKFLRDNLLYFKKKEND